MPTKFHKIRWRGFSGHVHTFTERCFIYNGRWCYKDEDGGIRSLSIAISSGIVSAKPWPKKRPR